MKSITICAFLLLISGMGYTQIGGLKDKVKDKAKDAGQSDKKVDAPSTAGSGKATVKDADGYVINDPEVKTAHKNLEVYSSTDFALFGSVLETSNPFKMAGVGVNKEGENLTLNIVAQKKYGGILNKEVTLTKNSFGHYQSASTSNPVYAQVESNGSIHLFNSRKSELISKDESLIKAAKEADLQQKANGYIAEMKSANAEASQKKAIEENETFYKSGGVASVKKDAALEAQILKVLNDANKPATVPEKERVNYKKVMLIFTNWEVKKNALDQPVKQIYAAWAEGSYTADGRCFFQKVYVKKDHLGGGQYSEIVFDEAQRPSVVSCDLMK